MRGNSSGVPVAGIAVLALLTLPLAPVTLFAQATTRGADPNLRHLAREVERLAAATDGVLGVGALHLQTGRMLLLNGDQPFPMASSYKVPIAVELLTRADRGAIRLDSMITLRPGDIHPGSGMIAELLPLPGVALSLRNLLELMLLISDNSATDVVLRVAGGGAAVTERMGSLGVQGLRVDRPTIGLIADFAGVPGLPADHDVPIEQYRVAARAVTQAARDSAAAAFDRDPRDTATPAAMLALLASVWQGRALGAESRALLLDIMTRSTTGAGRIRGMLPADVAVAHKTGTIGGTTNDVGIITLPEGAGDVAIVLFVRESRRPVEARERVIAQVARAIYDYFVFHPTPAPTSQRGN
jgi:beta-lactamase class A